MLYILSFDFFSKDYCAISKSLSVFLLAAVVAFYSFKIKNRFFIICALVLSGFGDIFLALGVEKHFLYGVLCFLGAHVFYIMTFLGYLQKPLFKSIQQKAMCIAAVLFGITMLFILKAHIPSTLAIPVYAYIVTLSFMFILSIGLTPFPSVVFWGAVLFCVSDSLLGINEFLLSYVGHNYLIWITYYAAQVLIVFGLILLNRPHMLAKFKIKS